MGSKLTSAAIPPVGPDDHVRGAGPQATLYLDLACPHCAASWERIRELPLRLCVRNFPMASKHARSPALHAAAEAADLQVGEGFFEICDRVYERPGHQDDPHLWDYARALQLDLTRFDDDRRSEAVAARTRRDFETGIRAGVTGTPAAFINGKLVGGDVEAALRKLAEAPG